MALVLEKILQNAHEFFNESSFLIMSLTISILISTKT